MLPLQEAALQQPEVTLKSSTYTRWTLVISLSNSFVLSGSASDCRPLTHKLTCAAPTPPSASSEPHCWSSQCLFLFFCEVCSDPAGGSSSIWDLRCDAQVRPRGSTRAMCRMRGTKAPLCRFPAETQAGPAIFPAASCFHSSGASVASVHCGWEAVRLLHIVQNDQGVFASWHTFELFSCGLKIRERTRAKHQVRISIQFLLSWF